MKKLFLLSAAALAGVAIASAEAPEPLHLSNACINKIAPNGTLGVSQGYSSGVQIFDLVSGNKLFEIPGDEIVNIGVGVGVGNGISNTGMVLLSTDGFLAEYWKDGEIYTLDYPDEAIGNNSANGITPDGKRICGYVGVYAAADSQDDVLMNVPCIWNEEGENEYSKPIVLPHPTKDLTGRVPQYVMANFISEDGKTILGSMVDCVGNMSVPLIWKEDADGKWSYEIVHEELYKHEDIVFPEFAGDFDGDYPWTGNFMTEEELAAFEEAENAYYNGLTDEYPNPADYMTAEEIAAFNAYVDEYNTWAEAFNNWYGVYELFCDACPKFDMNSFMMSANGKFMATSVATPIDDPFAWFTTFSYAPWVFDLTTGDITKYADSGSIMATYVANDGAVLGTDADFEHYQQSAFIIENGKCSSMNAWIGAKVPAYETWITENMTFEVYGGYWDDELDEFVDTVDEVTMTGVPTATPDLSKIGLWIENSWDYMTEAEAFLFDIQGGTVGVGSVATEAEGKVIYDLSGRQLKEITAPGIYVINGKKVIVK